MRRVFLGSMAVIVVILLASGVSAGTATDSSDDDEDNESSNPPTWAPGSQTTPVPTSVPFTMLRTFSPTSEEEDTDASTENMPTVVFVALCFFALFATCFCVVYVPFVFFLGQFIFGFPTQIANACFEFVMYHSLHPSVRRSNYWYGRGPLPDSKPWPPWRSRLLPHTCVEFPMNFL